MNNISKKILSSIVSLFAVTQTTHAQANFDVLVWDRNNEFSNAGIDVDLLKRNVEAAAEDWRFYLPNSQGQISALVSPNFGAGTVTGRSGTSVFLQSRNGLNVYEQGVAHELRTGVDPNGTATSDSWDVFIEINPVFFADEVWLDTSPRNRRGRLPSNKRDAVSIFLEEYGHAIAYNGWRANNGSLPNGNTASTFDERVTVGSGNYFWFTGPDTRSFYGNYWLPLTKGNATHVGNVGTTEQILIRDVMFGPSKERGRRYYISNLNLAMLRDMGISTR